MEFHKKITLKIHENNKICVIFVMPCISLKNSKYGMPLIHIHKPKILNLSLKRRSFLVMCGQAEKSVFASDHPVFQGRS